MSTMNAIIIQGDSTAKVVSDTPIPKVRPDYVLVRVKAVALNPTDWKHVDRGLSPGAKAGMDFSGIVEAIPEGPLTRQYKVGDRICGTAFGGNQSDHEHGTFSEFIIAKTGSTMPIPSTVSFQDAATFGVAVLTCAQGLYQKLDLPLPGNYSSTEKPSSQDVILIYGGSSAMGTMAIQYAKLSGLIVIATASAKNLPLLKSRGADHAIDYKSAGAVSTIRSLAPSLRLAFDCIGESGSASFCAATLTMIAPANGLPIRYDTLIPPAPESSAFRAEGPKVEMSSVVAYTSYGEKFEKFGMVFERSEEDYLFASKLFEISEKLLEQGKLIAHPLKVAEGGVDGLEGVLNGMQFMKEGKVSGVKLVYNLD